MTDPVRRRCARVVVTDAADRVLLLQGRDPARPEHVFWHAPGGGLHDGETPEQAARRELSEEVGLDAEQVGPVIWHRRLQFSFDRIPYDQDEVYFHVRVERHVVDPSGREANELRYLGEGVWWSVADLRATAELVAPPDLADRLEELLRDGPPARPVELLGAVLP
jgi:8-oxo-dGTP pyrophosphatase MutT (NUDIX family)